MRLDPDCIRDILLYIEEHTTDANPFVSTDELKSNLNKYNSDKINYHIRQIDQAGLVDSVDYAEGVPQDISSLSWEGNAYIANIRDDNIWAKVKGRIKGLPSVAFSILIECAKEEVKKYIHLS
jgi:hypothetical protein